VLLRRKARRLRKETGNDGWKAPIEIMSKSILKTVLWSCIRPFQLLVLEPMCLNLCLLSAILLGILYLFFGAFPLVFEHNHGFTLSQVGLTFLGLFVGMIAAILSDPIWRKNYRRLVRQSEDGVSQPEFRLPPTIFGAILSPIALFCFAWTTFPWVSFSRFVRGTNIDSEYSDSLDRSHNFQWVLRNIVSQPPPKVVYEHILTDIISVITCFAGIFTVSSR